MTTSKSQSQPNRWAYPPTATPTTASSGPRHSYSASSTTPATSFYPPASAYPSPSSIYRPQFPTRSGARPRRKNNKVRNIVLAVVALLLASAAAIVVVLKVSSDGGKSSKDAAFISAIHRGVPLTNKVANAEIVKAGHIVCGALDADPTVKSVAAALTRHKYRYTAAQRSIFMRDSIAAYCPQFSYLVPRAV